MSFTSIVKNELSKIEFDKLEIISELSGIFRNSSTIDKTIKFSTENASVSRRVYNDIKEIYQVNSVITVRHGYNYNKNYIYILEINKNIKKIINDLNLDKEIPDNYLIDDDILSRAYLRGVFIASGSINDPKKSRYHLEFLVDNLEYANFVMNLLNEYYLNSKVLRRENKYMIYMKEAEKIGDFLRILETKKALFYYEDIRIYRDHKNMTNRLNNCEQANMDKIFFTASRQLKDIETLKENDLLDVIDDKLKEVIEYREKYPESSLQELSEIMSKELGYTITKSGLNHRFRKIKEIVNRISSK